jgi:hypothetical protein
MTNLTPEMIEKAKAAKSAEELLALAKLNNVEMTDDEAKTYFAQLNPKSGELDDDELDNVAGGAGGCSAPTNKETFPVGTRVRTPWACYCGNYTGVIKMEQCSISSDMMLKVCCDKCNRVYCETETYRKNWVDELEIIG